MEAGKEGMNWMKTSWMPSADFTRFRGQQADLPLSCCWNNSDCSEISNELSISCVVVLMDDGNMMSWNECPETPTQVYPNKLKA